MARGERGRGLWKGNAYPSRQLEQWDGPTAKRRFRDTQNCVFTCSSCIDYCLLKIAASSFCAERAHLCTQERSVGSGAETQLSLHKHTQTQANSQCSHVDRVLELWLQDGSVCVCCFCLFAGDRCCSVSVSSPHNLIICVFSPSEFQAVPSSPTVPESRP